MNTTKLTPLIDPKSIVNSESTILIYRMPLWGFEQKPVEVLLNNYNKFYDQPCPRHSLAFGTNLFISLLNFLETKPYNLLECHDCKNRWAPGHIPVALNCMHQACNSCCRNKLFELSNWDGSHLEFVCMRNEKMLNYQCTYCTCYSSFDVRWDNKPGPKWGFLYLPVGRDSLDKFV